MSFRQEIILMELYSQQRSGEVNFKPDRKHQITEFEAFKDQQFIRHKRQQSEQARNTLRAQNFTHVLAVTNLKTQTHLGKKQLNLSVQQYSRKNHRDIREATLQSSKIEVSQLQPTQRKVAKNPKMPRYTRASNSEIKIAEDTCSEEYRSKQTNQNISILTKIIEHYNSKSMHQSIQSNLINKVTANSTSTNSCKNKLIAIRRMAPKVSLRKDLFKHINRIQVLQLKIKNKDIQKGLDFFDAYFDHSQILVEAQGLNELIKNKQKDRKIVNKSVNDQELYRQRKSAKKVCYNPAKKVTKYDTLPTEKSKLLDNHNIETSINTKVNKFKGFLFLINYANQVYRQLQFTKHQSTFKIYLGKGNNSNLIKAIMKRRFWFQVAKTPEEAHFVWTQIKEQAVYQRQMQLQQLKNRVTPEFQSIEGNNLREQQQEVFLKEQIVETIHTVTEQPTDEENKKTKERTFSKSRSQRQRSTSYEPETKILTKQQHLSFKQLMHELGHRRKTQFNGRASYLKHFTVVSLDELKESIVHNHLPLNGLLGNKKAMFYMLRQYYKLTSRDIFSVVPLTFHIKKGVLDAQYKQFMNRFVQNRIKGLPNYWIVKPGEFSNRGQGISCTNRLEEIKNRITKLKGNKGKSLIVQRYLTNPLLYNGRKFDIRTYMLLTVNNKKLRGYWYQDGYIRTASYQWSLEDIADNEIHLTNDAIQKYSNNYGRYEPGNKLTYSQLQRYIDSLQRPNGSKSWSIQADIYPQMKEIAADAIKSTFCFIDPQRLGNNFEIFGFDFMIDNNFKPWLIEINTNPCLQMSCPVLNRIIPSMVENALRIGLDPIIPPPLNYSSTYKYSIPENALHYNKFELIFDEDRDGPALAQMYRNSTIVKEIDEYEEDKDVYEQQGQQICLEEQ